MTRPPSIALSELLSQLLDERHNLPDTLAIYVVLAGDTVLSIGQQERVLEHGYL